MTWQFDVNQAVPATNSIAMYRLIVALLAQGWTKVKDSDGTTYSSSGTQITSGAAGAGGLANNSAWFVLRQPGTNAREIFIQRGTTNTVWKMKISTGPSTGFVGGSPSATQGPSATDEQVITGGGTDASPTFGSLFSTTDNTNRCDIVTGGASEGYSFIVFNHTSGGTVINNVLMLDSGITNGDSLDQDPCVLYFAQGSPFTANFKSGSVSPGAEGCRAHFKKNLAGAAFVRQQLGDFYGGGINLGGNASMGQNLYVNKDEILPVFYWNSVAPGPGKKGVSKLLLQSTVQRAVGDTVSIASTKDRMHIATTFAYLIPWNGTDWLL